MTFSSIMVHVDLAHSNDSCLRVAFDLAEKFDAKLIGVAAASFYGDEVLTERSLNELRCDITKQLAALEEHFRSMAAGRSVEWRSALERPADYVSCQACAADLIVIGAKRGGSISDLTEVLDPGDLVMRVGRPILVVPPQVDSLKFKLAMVCWKDTREARRAVSDALPLVREFKEVGVFEVIKDESSRDAAHSRLDDVVSWLERHGIGAFARVFNGAEGEDPTERLFEYGSDLIVAGAYGHGRLREWVFGGFTESLFRRSPVCSFLAH